MIYFYLKTTKKKEIYLNRIYKHYRFKLKNKQYF